MSAELSEVCGLLRLDIIEARGIPVMDLNGKADPYVVVKFGTRTVWRSQTQKKTRTPTWHESMKLLIETSEKNYDVVVEVWDWDKASADDLIGVTRIDIQPLLEKQDEPVEMWLPLHLPKKEKKERGELHVAARIMSRLEVERLFWLAFAEHFDVEHNGSLDQIEFNSLLAAIALEYSDEEAKELYEKADVDKNGNLDYEEVWRVMNQNRDLTASFLKDDPNLLWRVYAHATDYHDVGGLVMEKNFSMSGAELSKKDRIQVLFVHNRATGKAEEEKIPHYIEVAMRLMYQTKSGLVAVNQGGVKKLLRHLSVSQGKKYDDPNSKKEIENFVKFHNLNLDEILDPMDSFSNFNEFFYRKLKTEARPIFAPEDATIATSPADCRLNVFQSVDDAQRLWIKGAHFSPSALIGKEELASKYLGGSVLISRLAPQDYHRFHVPVSGTIGPTDMYDGTYYTVNPIAVRNTMDVYTENKRAVTIINSDAFGQVLFVAIGATMVGSIVHTAKEGQRVNKGDELGYFAFGGSTVLLFFLPGAIEFDADLLVNSNKPIETLIKMGDSIGKVNATVTSQ